MNRRTDTGGCECRHQDRRARRIDRLDLHATNPARFIACNSRSISGFVTAGRTTTTAIMMRLVSRGATNERADRPEHSPGGLRARDDRRRCGKNERNRENYHGGSGDATSSTL
jgi:hypothetical protein